MSLAEILERGLPKFKDEMMDMYRQVNSEHDLKKWSAKTLSDAHKKRFDLNASLVKNLITGTPVSSLLPSSMKIHIMLIFIDEDCQILIIFCLPWCSGKRLTDFQWQFDFNIKL